MVTAASLRFRLIGVSPLIMHSARLVDPVDPIAREIARLARKRGKTDSDNERLGHLEWVGGLWTSAGRPCLPAEAIEAALVVAARRRKLGKETRAGLICPDDALLQYDGPADLVGLWRDPQFRLRTPVQVAHRRLMRTRPRFIEWRAEVRVEYLPSVLNADAIGELVRVAGDIVGIGDWRPRFGRFRVENL